MMQKLRMLLMPIAHELSHSRDLRTPVAAPRRFPVVRGLDDGRSQSEIRQGVTLQVFGEGLSWGPLNDRVRQALIEFRTPGIEYDFEWTTLGEYLEYLKARGISTNVASFVGATTVRIHALGRDESIEDHATFEEPHQYASGVIDVFVNGRQVLRRGEHTGATPGRVVRGPGWTGWPHPDHGAFSRADGPAGGISLHLE
jgi:N-acyl-D-aspartate/D-glutamate deacylase